MPPAPSLIFLCGFMGSGKTTLGRELAASMKYHFIDLDEEIEKTLGHPVSKIFASKGEPFFRSVEMKVLSDVTAQSHNMVIALGGGTVCHQSSLDLIKENGLLIYLKVSAGTLINRLRTGQQNRPLLAGHDTDLEKRVTSLLGQRQPYYEQAELIVQSDDLTSVELQKHILAYRSSHKH